MPFDVDDEGRRILGNYIPSVPLAAVGAVVYFALAAVLLLRTHYIHRGLEQRRFGTFMWPATLGCFFMALGFIVRVIFSSHYDSLGIYIFTTLFILLSPCFFLWATYRILGELGHRLGEDVSQTCLIFSARFITRVFVTADITTFLIQATGGGLSAIRKVANTGSAIALAGLAIQLASVGFFTIMVLVFGLRVRSRFPAVWSSRKGNQYDWRILWIAMLAACAGYLVRSVFRLVEYSQGYDGYLATHEAFLYTLDTLPLALSLSVLAMIWPPLYTTQQSSDDSDAGSDTDFYQLAARKPVSPSGDLSTAVA